MGKRLDQCLETRTLRRGQSTGARPLLSVMCEFDDHALLKTVGGIRYKYSLHAFILVMRSRHLVVLTHEGRVWFPFRTSCTEKIYLPVI